jgi:hypothetical protein
MTTTFFTVVTRLYWPFVVPYAASVLHHNDDAVVEICVQGLKSFRKKHSRAISAINEKFPDRFHLRRGNFKGITPGMVRFVETPEWMSEYTYIGDVDILILEPNITDAHLADMHRSGLPYSNVLRPNRQRLTGLHFTRSDRYYPVRLPTDLDWLSNGEEALYRIVAANGLPLPNPDDHWRPVHGIHLSLNRAPTNLTRPDWEIYDEVVEPYLALRASDSWRQISRHFDPAYQMILLILEAVMQAQHPEIEIYEIAEAQALWRHLTTKL